jgi:hypothetical protein
MHLGAESTHLPSLIPDLCPLSDDCLPPNSDPSVWTVPKQIRSNADGYAGRCKGWLPLQGRPPPVGRSRRPSLRPAVCPDILEPRKDPRLFFFGAPAPRSVTQGKSCCDGGLGKLRALRHPPFRADLPVRGPDRCRSPNAPPARSYAMRGCTISRKALEREA